MILRNRILAGDLEPGSRLPTKIDLSKQYDASGGTVQKVLDALTDEGFIHSRGCLGTFVAEAPPHTSRFGLVFQVQPEASIWVRALAAAAKDIQHRSGRWLSCYFDCWRHEHTVSAGLAQLETDIDHGRLAGLICACGPDALVGSRALAQPGMARVFVSLASPRADIPVIKMQPTYPQAIAHLAAAGRRRFALITTFNLYQTGVVPILKCAAENGMETERRWVHYFDPKSDVSARAVCELMMTLPPDNRPDALFISDDHLVHEATLGIADAGLGVRDQISIVAHANFPNPPAAAVPVTFLGYDVPAILQTALNLIDQQLQDLVVPRTVWIEPVSQPGA